MHELFLLDEIRDSQGRELKLVFTQVDVPTNGIIRDRPLLLTFYSFNRFL